MLFTVSPGEAGTRLDVFIAQKYSQYSRSTLNLLFEKDLIRVNGSSVKRGLKLKTKDQVEADDSLLYQTYPLKLSVVYEDNDVVVIDKPSGILTHSKGALNLEGTVASFIQPNLADDLSGNRAGIVHRLDRATSGLIITAKNLAAQKYLQKQFADRKVAKTYLAIVSGHLTPPEGAIDVPLARNPRKPKTFVADKSGKSAQTTYAEISAAGGYSLVELHPKTGRTHQLRVHLSYLGSPVVGDELYGGEAAARLMLHAKELKLSLPSGKVLAFISELPEELSQYV